MFDQIPLHLMASGQTARVSQLIGGGDSVQRLQELGLRSGTEIEMVQPGSPCIIRLHGSKLCFRRSDQLNVLVQEGDVA